MPSQSNQDRIAALQEKVARAKSIAIVDYSGTTGTEQVALRQALKDAGTEMLVTKNTLIDIVVGKGKLGDALQGMNAIVFSYEDEVSGPKALFKFHKDSEKLVIKNGALGDRVLNHKELEALSALPGKQELIATLLARLNGPGTGLLNVLQAGTRNLVQVLTAITKKE